MPIKSNCLAFSVYAPNSRPAIISTILHSSVLIKSVQITGLTKELIVQVQVKWWVHLTLGIGVEAVRIAVEKLLHKTTNNINYTVIVA